MDGPGRCRTFAHFTYALLYLRFALYVYELRVTYEILHTSYYALYACTLFPISRSWFYIFSIRHRTEISHLLPHQLTSLLTGRSPLFQYGR